MTFKKDRTTRINVRGPGIELKADVVLTPDEVAEGFCHLDAGQQAAVFEEIGRIAEKWSAPDVLQWHEVSRELRNKLNLSRGKRIVEELASCFEEGS